MRYRRITCILLAISLAAACGGGKTSTDDTTTSSSSVVTAPPKRQATAGQIASVMVQIDDHMRRAVADADSCLHGPHRDCVGPTLGAYNDIQKIAKQIVEIVPLLGTEGSEVYQGEFGPALTARVDETINYGAMVKGQIEKGQATCIPDFPPECDEIHTKLGDALVELYKRMNAWRDDYHPVTGGTGSTVTVAP